MNVLRTRHSDGPVLIHDILEHGVVTHVGNFSHHLEKRNLKHLSISHRTKKQMQNFHSSFICLTTGRVASQWHTRTRTGKVPQLTRKDPEPFVEIHPERRCCGERRRRWKMGLSCRATWEVLCLIVVLARSPCLVCYGYYQARVAFHAVPLGILLHRIFSMLNPMSIGNYVTNSAFDPVSKQPELKFCAVRIETDDVT